MGIDVLERGDCREHLVELCVDIEPIGRIRQLLLFLARFLLILEPPLQHHHHVTLHRDRIGGTLAERYRSNRSGVIPKTHLRLSDVLSLRPHVPTERHIRLSADTDLSGLFHRRHELDGQLLRHRAHPGGCAKALGGFSREHGDNGFRH